MRISTVLSFTVFLLLSCSPESNGTDIGTPVLVAPINGSTITQNPPTLIWQSVQDATGYDLVVADDTFFSYPGTIAEAQCYNDTNYTMINTLGSGTYFWRVRALEGG
jgi:hypothetical protein